MEVGAHVRVKQNSPIRCLDYYTSDGVFDRSSWAKDYNKWYKAQPSNKATAKQLMAVWRKQKLDEKREFLRQAKLVPCADCGQTHPPYVMDFDHARGAKVGKMSELIGRSWKTFLDEFEKCDVVCANCHKTRTWKRSHPCE